ncbi:DNA-binding response regulator [Secundilactobacillus paracollinoides]|uniref:DNA-binding response regulator n=1 Tax=Secundilactobacillus paracollinoides TaxID=240427 RepID=A0A1B2IV41_9LACO|nr:response regulator transcription factor [Secundilactobacillus paracollinoides]ANZ60113.1 DNA-binding response regulator [Secundilactobacillus paracollinoides]ANZ62932.1 DNA-binding response regulator [Secundilactobacillus paracollinoides]ANZ65907.1 DNA-binding response regulator [Secundilactobacillus paracollinoides]
MKVTILLVEDEDSLISYLQQELQFEDYDVITATRGEDTLEQYAAHKDEISLLILDWMLPGLDGLAVIRRIRKQNDDVPIIMMTARDYVGDKVSGLDAGADDYITKPFDIEELLARIRVILRHSQQHENRDDTYQLGNLTLDAKARQVTYADNVVQLTQREYELLLVLIQHQGEALTRDELLDLVWGVNFEGQVNIVDVYVRYLRTKLDKYADKPLIETIRGVGYRLGEDAK